MNDHTQRHLESLGIIPFGASSFNRASKEEVQALEKRLGNNLPSELRTILLLYGETTFDNEVIFIGEDGGRYIFGSFFGFHSILEAVKSPPGQFPPGCLAFGDEGLGNLYCLGLEGNLEGKVMYWDHEIGWGSAESYVTQGLLIPANVIAPCLRMLAASFGAFLKLLHHSNS